MVLSFFFDKEEILADKRHNLHHFIQSLVDVRPIKFSGRKQACHNFWNQRSKSIEMHFWVSLSSKIIV